MSNLLFLGPPASGKGTQAKKVSSQYGWPHISTGDMFRAAYAQRTALGKEAHDTYWRKGLLVPDEITNTLAFERLKQDDCKEGYILDGYPRTLGQATALNHFFLQGKKEGRQGLDAVIFFDCSEEVLIERAASRRVCRACGAIYKSGTAVCQCLGELYQRPDDYPKIVRERLGEYILKTSCLLEFYRKFGLLREIDATQSEPDVLRDICKLI